MAEAAFELAHTLHRLAGTQEAQICRRTDGRDRRKASSAPPSGNGRSAQQVQGDAGEYYRKKRETYLVDPPKTYDRDLRRLFSADPKHRHSETAASFIRRNRARVRELVSKWTGEYQLTFDAVLDDMIARCRKLKLRAVGAERALVMELTILLTAKTMHALFGPSRRKWIAL